jgi:hypothetical protein
MSSIIPKSWYHRAIDKLYSELEKRDDYAVKKISMELLIPDESDPSLYILCEAIVCSERNREDYYVSVRKKVR